jgi:hypothetical protein
MAVNEAGDVAGRGRISSPQGWGNVSQAFVRPSGAKMIALPTLSGYRNGFAYDLQDSRIVIGESRTLANGSNGSAACIWRWGVISNLNGLLPSGSGVYLSSAWRINARGELLCEGSSQTGRVAVLLTPIHAPYGDINLDCEVNLVDLVTIIDQWGNANSPADVNGDGIVNVDDLLIVINNWSSAP